VIGPLARPEGLFPLHAGGYGLERFGHRSTAARQMCQDAAAKAG
jgi:hypothetical protein